MAPQLTSRLMQLLKPDGRLPKPTPVTAKTANVLVTQMRPSIPYMLQAKHGQDTHGRQSSHIILLKILCKDVCIIIKPPHVGSQDPHSGGFFKAA